MSAPPVPSEIASVELPSPQLLKYYGLGDASVLRSAVDDPAAVAAARALLEEASALRRLLVEERTS